MSDGGIRVWFREIAGHGILRRVKLTEELFWGLTLILHRPNQSSRELTCCWKLRYAIVGSVWGDSSSVHEVENRRFFPGVLLHLQGSKAREEIHGAFGRSGWTGMISGSGCI